MLNIPEAAVIGSSPRKPTDNQLLILLRKSSGFWIILPVFLILIFLLAPSLFFAEDIYLHTIPKCGTHMAFKYFNLLNRLEKEPKLKILHSHFEGPDFESFQERSDKDKLKKRKEPRVLRF